MTSVLFHLLMGVMFIAADCQPLITASPEYLCLGDSVQLICSAQGSARWRSDDILGPNQTITFSILNTNSPVNIGNGTGVLIETSPRIVTSLSFNLTADRVETSCIDNQDRTTTNISSVQPSPNDDFSVNISYSMNISGGNFTWRPPSNIYDFLLREYRLTVECNDTVVIDESVAETTYSYDVSRLILGRCNATVAVINSCGDTASNSISFRVVVRGNNTVIMEGENEGTTGPPRFAAENDDGSNTGLYIGLGVGGLALAVVVIIAVAIVVYCCCCKNKKNKKKEGSQGFTQYDGDEKTDNQYSL